MKQNDEMGKHEIDHQRKKYEAQSAGLRETYDQQFQHNSKGYQDNLKHQNDQFQSTFKHNDAAQRESLNIQKEMYNKQLAEDKGAMAGKIKHYDDIKSDPFYKLENPDSDMRRPLSPMF